MHLLFTLERGRRDSEEKNGCKTHDEEVGLEIPKIFLKITMIPWPVPICKLLLCHFPGPKATWYNVGACVTKVMELCMWREAIGRPQAGERGLWGPGKSSWKLRAQCPEERRGAPGQVQEGHIGNYSAWSIVAGALTWGPSGHQWPVMSVHSFQRLWKGDKDHSCAELSADIISSHLQMRGKWRAATGGGKDQSASGSGWGGVKANSEMKC